MLFAATLSDACGEDPGTVCEWVFDATDSERLAEIADWLIQRPLRIALILLTAIVLNFIVRRALGRFVDRVAREREQDAEPPSRLADLQWLEMLRERNERARQRALTLAAVLRNVASVIIYGLGALLCLGELDINLGPLIAGAGIAGLAIGFGAQTLVRDFLAGIFIVLEDQYGVGDDVSLGDAAGTVEKITLRTTSLRDLDGTLWVVPNGEIKRVANRSQRWSRAVLDLRIGADADLDHAMEVARDGARQFFEQGLSHGDALEAPEVLGIESFVDGAAVLRVTVRTRPGKQFDVARRLRAHMRRVFLAAGIRELTDI
ncbi:MAG TPA: mechanosensitive ion channel family protein [Acidimicrobiales bacterium]